MPKPMIRIHDVETNEIIDREMNDEEFAAYKIQQQKAVEFKESEKLAEITKQTLFEKLGITPEEAQILLK